MTPISKSRVAPAAMLVITCWLGFAAGLILFSGYGIVLGLLGGILLANLFLLAMGVVLALGSRSRQPLVQHLCRILLPAPLMRRAQNNASPD